MASFLTITLQCSVCKNVFTDPVDLPCNHTFCQKCISDLPQPSSGRRLCPDCRQPFTLKDLKPNSLLRNLVEAGREELTMRAASAATDPQRGAVSPLQRFDSTELVCAEHDEKLKLFCETDQKMICVICRDCAAHRGHSFKPVKEAANACFEVLKQVCEFISRDNSDVEFLLKLQTAEGTKTKEKSRSLSAEISGNFEQLHQFLREREAEVMGMLECEERRVTESIQRNVAVVEGQLQEGRRQQEALQSALHLQQSDQLLQWWSESGSSLIEGMKLNSSCESSQLPKCFKSRVKGLSLTMESIYLGPYESHLPFFVWKKMMSCISPVPERLTVKDPGDQRLRVSLERSSVRHTDRQDGVNKDYNPILFVLENFQTGQHYWEVEVREKLDWGVGVAVSAPQLGYNRESIMLFLSHNKGYCVREFKNLSPVLVQAKPRRVGVYLDCERKLVSFFNADSMTLLYTSRQPFAQVLSLCLSPGLYLDGHNSAPLRMCWY